MAELLTGSYLTPLCLSDTEILFIRFFLVICRFFICLIQRFVLVLYRHLYLSDLHKLSHVFLVCKRGGRSIAISLPVHLTQYANRFVRSTAQCSPVFQSLVFVGLGFRGFHHYYFHIQVFVCFHPPPYQVGGGGGHV